MARIWEEREPLMSTHKEHNHMDFGHHHHHDEYFHHQFHECTSEAKIKKSPSESSEATVIVDAWTPPSCIQCHPAKYEMSDNKLASYTPVWVPNPESLDERDVRPRTLVLCFDGTGDQFDDGNSNVIQFLSCLKKNDKERQLVYYQTGIGTTTSSNFITPVLTQISKTLDLMFAWNLSSHVQDGYQFLVQNYKAGDRISIFGFSRGAYTARALAGMIERVGLLPADNTQQIPFAWSMYIRDDEDAEKDSAVYKRTFSSNVIVDFVGVWDTVASVGIIEKDLPFVKNNTAIRVFRHAIALDEHRAKFMPNFYHANSPSKMSVQPVLPTPNLDSQKASGSDRVRYPMKKPNDPTDACEVWFAGCHCDVGGGSVKNGTPHALARIPLRWMIRECFRMETGIVFDGRLLYEEFGLDYTTLYPVVKPRPERILWGQNCGPIQEMQAQGWGIVTFAKFLLALVALPIRIVLAVVTWPLRHTWLFLKYTKPIKKIRKGVKRASKAIGIHWVAHKVRDLRSWIDKKLFPKDNITPEPCTGHCQNEEDHEYWDALSPIYDQLEIRWFWKVIEYLPLRFVKQKNGRNDYYVAFNCGEGRKIYGDALYKNVASGGAGLTNGGKKGLTDAQTDAIPTVLHTSGTYHKTGGLKIHRSVLTRLEAQTAGKPKYKPNAWWGRRVDVGDGKKGSKTKGPDRWDISDPDPVKYWEWVE